MSDTMDKKDEMNNPKNDQPAKGGSLFGAAKAAGTKVGEKINKVGDINLRQIFKGLVLFCGGAAVGITTYKKVTEANAQPTLPDPEPTYVPESAGVDIPNLDSTGSAEGSLGNDDTSVGF